MFANADVMNALFAAMRRSHASAIDMPAPAAAPGNAAIVGLARSNSRSVSVSWPCCRRRTASSSVGRGASVGAARRTSAHSRHVAAGTERPTRAGDHDAAHRGVGLDGQQRLAQRRRQLVRQRIAFVRTIQRDRRNAVFDAAQQLVRPGIQCFRGQNAPPRSAPSRQFHDETNCIPRSCMMQLSSYNAAA